MPEQPYKLTIKPSRSSSLTILKQKFFSDNRRYDRIEIPYTSNHKKKCTAVFVLLICKTSELHADSAQLLHDSAQLLRDSTQLLRDSVQLLRDRTQLLRDSAQLLRESTQLLRDSAQILRESARLLC